MLIIIFKFTLLIQKSSTVDNVPDICLMLPNISFLKQEDAKKDERNIVYVSSIILKLSCTLGGGNILA